MNSLLQTGSEILIFWFLVLLASPPWMNLDGSGWVWLDLDGSGWLWVDLHGSGWIWMDLDGSGWNLAGSGWICAGPLGPAGCLTLLGPWALLGVWPCWANDHNSDTREGNLPKLIFRIQFSIGEFTFLVTFFNFLAIIFNIFVEFSDPVFNRGFQFFDDTFQFFWKLPKTENELNSLT